MSDYMKNYKRACRGIERESLKEADDRLLNLLSIITQYIAVPEIQTRIIEAIESHDRFMEVAEQARKNWEES